MESEIIKQATEQGLYAVLFVALLFYVLRENAKRESSYQSIIERFSEKFDVIEKGISCIGEKVDRILKGDD